jgi:hypothetical protein
MRFTKIKVNDEGVELAWTIIDANGATTSSTYSSKERPAPELPAALEAFKPFVMDLVGLPDTWRETLRVSVLSLLEIKEGNRRGLMVSVKKKIERANNNPVSITTPLMKSATDNTTTDKGVFDDDIAALIATAERAAEAYFKGERMQGEIFKEGDGEQAQTDDVTKRRNRKKPKDVGTPNEVMNREKVVAMTDEALRKLLLSVGRDLPEDAIARMVSTDRDASQRWAEAVIDAKNDKPHPIADLIEPEFLKKYATPALGEEGWVDGKPPKLGDEEVAGIKAAATSGE